VTDREYLCLRYLDHLMESDAFAIGRYIYANLENPQSGGSNLPAIGAAVAGRLRKRGLVTFLPDLKAWRITTAGREALREFQ
jgi:hypothetical protein